MTRQRTKKSRYRTKKYRKKYIPREVNIRFKEALEWQIPQVNLGTYLRLDNIVEDQVTKLLLVKGITNNELKLYLACYRDLLEVFRKFKNQTLENELSIQIEKWLTRGLDKEIIDIIVDELRYKSQGWYLYDQYQEFSLMLDYLRVKVFGTVEYPRVTYTPISYILILPIYQKFTYTKPVNYQTIKTITLPKTYDPDKTIRYQTQYKVNNPNRTLSNFISYQLNITYE